MAQVVGYGAVDLLKVEDGERLSDALCGLAVQERIDDGVERDSGTFNPVALVTLLNVFGAHGVSSKSLEARRKLTPSASPSSSTPTPSPADPPPFSPAAPRSGGGRGGTLLPLPASWRDRRGSSGGPCGGSRARRGWLRLCAGLRRSSPAPPPRE